MSAAPFVIERTFNASAETIWQAITDKNKMKHWYFDIAEFRPEVGFEFQFTAENKNVKYVHLCKITDVIAGKKLRYSWAYEGYPGKSYVTFELFPEGDQTRLKLTHEGLETFPAHIADFAKENFAAGWTMIIGTNLQQFVEA